MDWTCGDLPADLSVGGCKTQTADFFAALRRRVCVNVRVYVCMQIIRLTVRKYRWNVLRQAIAANVPVT